MCRELEELLAIKVDSQYDNDDDQEIQWLIHYGEFSDSQKYGIEIIQKSEHGMDVHDAVDDSYTRVPDSMVISFKGKFFKSDFDLGSYIDSFGPWYEAVPKDVITTVYERAQ